MQHIDIERFLPLVEKPSRYIDHEINAIRKDIASAGIKVCFAFPDVYEVGISHLGIKILYSIVNAIPDAAADRCYLPWTDLLDIMRREAIPLFGLESRLPLKYMDMLGITLQSELTYTNVLELLDLAQIPVLRAERTDADPIVLAGGPCATNPQPLSDFVDVFFIGEAEDAIEGIIAAFRGTVARSERLERLATLPGCYVPVLHDPIRGKDASFSIRSVKYAGFASPQKQHTPQLLAWQLATHNRHVTEIMRGCSRGCRFCHAGYFYRPVRERDPQDILEALLQELNTTGWDEAGLLSLSSSDYSCIKELLFSLLATLDTHKTRVSLPSLRVDSLDDDLVELMRRLGREGLTIAPEAGSQRLRDVINKNLSQADILHGVQIAQELGWQRVKLYFMVGLPTETDADMEAIIALIDAISDLTRRRMQINVTLSPFVPKPFTPFERVAMLPADQLLSRCRMVKNAFATKRHIKIKYHTIENSLLEGLLSRGDARMGAVILRAWQNGARFDGWNECFSFQYWEEALQHTAADTARILGESSWDDAMPWGFIDTNVSADFLRSEWEKAARAELTPDCRELCGACGACDQEVQTVYAKGSESALPRLSDQPMNTRIDNPTHHRYRVHYSKTGVLRFISHLDWMRMLFRMVSYTPLSTVFTQGFNPHPKVSLSPPLPLGVESAVEFFDVSFYEPYPPESIRQAYLQGLIPGFEVHECGTISKKGQVPLGEVISTILDEKLAHKAIAAIQRWETATELPFTKDTGTRSKSYDLRQIITSAVADGGVLIMRKKLESPALYDVLAAFLEVDKAEIYALRVSRSGWIFTI